MFLIKKKTFQLINQLDIRCVPQTAMAGFLLDWIKSRTALDSGSLKAFVPLYSSLQVLLLLPEKI